MEFKLRCSATGWVGIKFKIYNSVYYNFVMYANLYADYQWVPLAHDVNHLYRIPKLPLILKLINSRLQNKATQVNS